MRLYMQGYVDSWLARGQVPMVICQPIGDGCSQIFTYFKKDFSSKMSLQRDPWVRFSNN